MSGRRAEAFEVDISDNKRVAKPPVLSSERATATRRSIDGGSSIQASTPTPSGSRFSRPAVAKVTLNNMHLLSFCS